MATLLLDVLTVVLLALGSVVMTISVYGLFRMPDVYSQVHAAGMASGLGAVTILLASIATRDAATVSNALTVSGSTGFPDVPQDRHATVCSDWSGPAQQQSAIATSINRGACSRVKS